MKTFEVKYQDKGRTMTAYILAQNWMDCRIQFRRLYGNAVKVISSNQQEKASRGFLATIFGS